MYEYVRPDKGMTALRWLKDNNPLYKNIAVNTDWLHDAAQDNGDLWEALSSQQSSSRVPATSEGDTSPSNSISIP